MLPEAPSENPRRTIPLDACSSKSRALSSELLPTQATPTNSASFRCARTSQLPVLRPRFQSPLRGLAKKALGPLLPSSVGLQSLHSPYLRGLQLDEWNCTL